MAERYPPVYLAIEPAPNGRLMTSRRKSASNCPGKCRYPTSVHPGFIGEIACLDTKTGVSRQKLARELGLKGFPATFRINGIKREEFMWVHDLRNWYEEMRSDLDWLPNVADLHLNRVIPSDWLT
jgi:hypothetical protein